MDGPKYYYIILKLDLKLTKTPTEKKTKLEGRKISISVSSITGMPGRTGILDIGITSSLIITAAMDSKDTHYDSYYSIAIALWNLPLLSLARRELGTVFGIKDLQFSLETFQLGAQPLHWSTPNLLNKRGKLFVGGPEIIEFERLLPCDQLLPDGNYPRGMIGNTWPCEVCFRVRESSKPTVINQHSVKLPGNNLLTISAVGPSVERALKRELKEIYI